MRIGKIFEDLFNPGNDEQNRALETDKQARQLWMSQFEQVPVYGHTGELLGYKPKINPLLNAEDMQAPELQDYQAQQVAWGDLGSSAYDTALDKPTEYFQNLTQGGPDAQAEAEYAQRVAQAERSRRAQTQAQLAQLETQGRSASGASLLAGLNAAQGSAADQYQAGLDVNAQAQARRDNAAQQWGNLATTQAQGQDAWNTWGQDLKYDVADRNANRRQESSDANTQQTNQTAWWNKVGSKQQAQDYQTGALQGATGQYGAVADAYREKGDSQHAFGPDIVGIARDGIRSGT